MIRLGFPAGEELRRIIVHPGFDTKIGQYLADQSSSLGGDDDRIKPRLCIGGVVHGD